MFILHGQEYLDFRSTPSGSDSTTPMPRFHIQFPLIQKPSLRAAITSCSASIPLQNLSIWFGSLATTATLSSMTISLALQWNTIALYRLTYFDLGSLDRVAMYRIWTINEGNFLNQVLAAVTERNKKKTLNGEIEADPYKMCKHRVDAASTLINTSRLFKPYLVC
ncbi:hypothetical protein L2E82_47611 [Cichorium intybus]|uniref:Uncharacterized protein n=1 Tax=Cichorium intybus TaxID=13427 RepID=A0ACB8YV84_CICIN|nr:hypothetical protein L2E82_47611 [Cichorium intybus]